MFAWEKRVPYYCFIPVAGITCYLLFKFWSRQMSPLICQQRSPKRLRYVSELSRGQIQPKGNLVNFQRNLFVKTIQTNLETEVFPSNALAVLSPSSLLEKGSVSFPDALGYIPPMNGVARPSEFPREPIPKYKFYFVYLKLGAYYSSSHGILPLALTLSSSTRDQGMSLSSCAEGCIISQMLQN